MRRPMILFALCGLTWLGLDSHVRAGYVQRNLISDIRGLAPLTADPGTFTNPWGVAVGAFPNDFWVSANGSGTSPLFLGDNKGIPFQQNANLPFVTIPPAMPGGVGNPTGQVSNGVRGDFQVSSGGKSGTSAFIFASEGGTISAWSPRVDLHNAIAVVDNSASGAVYKGLAVTQNPAGGNFLYAADFANNKIDVFDSKFAPAHPGGSFVDPNLPAGYAPFNLSVLGGKLYVAYALQEPGSTDNAIGPGTGFISVFGTDGTFQQRLASGNPANPNDPLNAPWGLALAPSRFGAFANDLLVGNFGDSRINAFDPNTGAFLGTLSDGQGKPIYLTTDGLPGPGLWGLTFGNVPDPQGSVNTLYFAAGLNDEENGLFGALNVVPEPSSVALLFVGAAGLGLRRYFRRGRRRTI